MHFLHIMEIRHESNCCRGTGSRERAIETGPCFKRRLPAKTTTPHLSTTNHHMQFCVTAQKLHRGFFFFCFSSSSFSLQHCSGFNWLSTDFHDKKKKQLLFFLGADRDSEDNFFLHPEQSMYNNSPTPAIRMGNLGESN